MEQPTYKMNRGAILAQGYRRLVEGVTEDVAADTGVNPLMNTCGSGLARDSAESVETFGD
ncbi:hypothetical protein B7453_24570 [Pseudomonas sp. IB20]|nr:hypothetical protein B7453_24570 [Pseudomonas sp. IB20]